MMIITRVLIELTIGERYILSYDFFPCFQGLRCQLVQMRPIVVVNLHKFCDLWLVFVIRFVLVVTIIIIIVIIIVLWVGSVSTTHGELRI